MFHSKLVSIKSYRSAFYAVVMSLSLILTSCSSVEKGIGEAKPDNNDRSTTDKGGTGSTQGDSPASTRPAFTGVDPMADIQINPEIKKAYQDVANFNKSKKYTQAINLLNIIKSKYPQLSGPDYQKARIYFSQGKLDEALAAVDASLKNNPRNYYSLNLKGIILREQGKFDEAREIYLIAIEIYPPYPNSHLNLGVLADIYMRDLPLALIQYKEYMNLVGKEDKTVANWVIELERRIKSGE